MQRTVLRFEEAVVQPRGVAKKVAQRDGRRPAVEPKGVTAAQLALAWVLHQGDFIVPIPGARKVRHLEENAAAADVVLTPADFAAINEAMPHTVVRGSRYTVEALALVDG